MRRSKVSIDLSPNVQKALTTQGTKRTIERARQNIQFAYALKHNELARVQSMNRSNASIDLSLNVQKALTTQGTKRHTEIRFNDHIAKEDRCDSGCLRKSSLNNWPLGK